jgi:hypothetical protein
VASLEVVYDQTSRRVGQGIPRRVARTVDLLAEVGVLSSSAKVVSHRLTVRATAP